ncbi:hypothetical protein D3C80_1609780 [compost metagenome]
MIGNFLPFKSTTLFHNNAAIIDELLQEGSVVNHFILTTQCRVFVFKCIKTVRTSCYDLFDPVAVQHLYIIISHHLEQKFVSGSAGRISRTPFFLTQDCKLYPYFIQNLYKGFGNSLRALIETSCTSNPEQYFWFCSFSHIFGHCFYRHALA